MRSGFVFLMAAALISASIAGAGTVAELGWLAGCWERVGGEAGSGEQWMAPAGETMLGVSRLVREGRTAAYEYLQIRESADGTVEFVAKPSGQEGVVFTLVKATGSEMVFENPEHDFPQRVIYRLVGDDQLVGRIEGATADGLKGVDFPMRRFDCEVGSAKQ